MSLLLDGPLCVYMHTSIYFGLFFQKILYASLWIEFLLAEIKKLKIMEPMYTQEKQGTTRIENSNQGNEIFKEF